MNQLVINQRTGLIFCLFILSIVAILLLVGPRVPSNQQKQQCVVDLHILGPFGVSLNCDSPEFMKDAVHPSLLLQKNSVRQSRPGMILAAYVFSKPLFFLNDIAKYLHPNVTRKDIAPSRVNALWQSGFAVYAAYLLLNIAILMMACYFYFKLVAVDNKVGMPALCLILLFFVNPVTKTYFWSPHTQMFNIMEPLFLCFILYRGFSRPIIEKWWYGITLTMGLLVTAYGTFLLYAPALFLIFAYQYKKLNYELNPLSFYIIRLACHAIIFSVPTIVWYFIVIHAAGSYYIHEAVVYRQFVWMGDAWHHGWLVLLRQLLLNSIHVLGLIIEQGYLLLLAVIVVWFALKKKQFEGWDKSKMIAIGMTLLLSASFVILNGFVIARMASTAIPVIIAACGCLMECLFSVVSSKQQRRMTVTCLLFVLIYSLSLLS